MAGVELRAVSKRVGKTYAVRNVSLSVDKGEFLSLVGPSGCGKTTTLRLVAGFSPRTKAKCCWTENPWAGWSPAAAGRHRLPELCPFPQPHRVRKRGLRSPDQKNAGGCAAPQGGRTLSMVGLDRRASAWPGSFGRPAAAGLPSHGPWPSRRRSSSWTSLCRPWTQKSGTPCGSR